MVYLYSTIKMMHGPINLRSVFDRFCLTCLLSLPFSPSKYSELAKFLSASYQHVNCAVLYIIFEQFIPKGRQQAKSVALLCDTQKFCHTLAGAVWFSGVCHADDLGYLFRVGHMDPDLDPESPEAKTRSRLVKMWTNFAKTGYVSLTFYITTVQRLFLFAQFIFYTYLLHDAESFLSSQLVCS